jgi:hypothetical protein
VSGFVTLAAVVVTWNLFTCEARRMEHCCRYTFINEFCAAYDCMGCLYVLTLSCALSPWRLTLLKVGCPYIFVEQKRDRLFVLVTCMLLPKYKIIVGV